MTMLSVYASPGSLATEETVRRHFQYLVRDRKRLAIRAAAVMFSNGNVGCSIGNIKPSQTDVKVSVLSSCL